MLIFIMFHLGISCTGHMTLPTDVMRQCHHYVGQVQAGELKGISPYHILLDNTFNFNSFRFGI